MASVGPVFQGGNDGARPDQANIDSHTLALVAKDIYDHRRMRSQLFTSDLFGEPAWDILLDLYIQTMERRPVDVTSASIASCVPPTTALRWLTILEKEELIERSASDLDRRRTFVRLSFKGLATIERYLERVIISGY